MLLNKYWKKIINKYIGDDLNQKKIILLNFICFCTSVIVVVEICNMFLSLYEYHLQTRTHSGKIL